MYLKGLFIYWSSSPKRGWEILDKSPTILPNFWCQSGSLKFFLEYVRLIKKLSANSVTFNSPLPPPSFCTAENVTLLTSTDHPSQAGADTGFRDFWNPRLWIVLNLGKKLSLGSCQAFWDKWGGRRTLGSWHNIDIWRIIMIKLAKTHVLLRYQYQSNTKSSLSMTMISKFMR